MLHLLSYDAGIHVVREHMRFEKDGAWSFDPALSDHDNCHPDASYAYGIEGLAAYEARTGENALRDAKVSDQYVKSCAPDLGPCDDALEELRRQDERMAALNAAKAAAIVELIFAGDHSTDQRR